MTVLLPAIAPVALIVLLGFIAARRLSWESKTLSQLVVYILSPALIVNSLYRTTLSSQSTVGLFLGFAIASLLLYLIVWLLGKLLRLQPILQKTLMATTLCSNAGNLGLPLNTFIYGEAGLERAVVYLIIAAVFVFTAIPPILRGDSLKSSFKLIFKLPLIWSIALGLILRALAVQLPPTLDKGLQQLGMAAIPVALILLGIQLANTPLRIGVYELCASGLRLLVAPLITFGVGRALQLEGLDLQVLVLQSAMPVAVNSVVLVAEFGGDPSLVARTVVVSTLSSFLTLPLVLWFSGRV
ncbi:AEC family transporter [Lusitaniella coriacea LEGE 07157]|uniref:AEC family transporter n=1 Tax=Lusitaniella coriacea LEGE 07157 TaxID=945747 RepID=A0A8J7DSL3_9CYAN|nr:AEC family transporter [Lusitaniella coriacea]MBE9114307.1 AEC family transporter [Lusitaniella coriacea LEGE 07157]